MARRNFFKEHARVLSFLAVLGLTSTLVLLLFDEARAVSIAADGPATALTSASGVQLTFTVAIPEDQLLPIESLMVTVRQTATEAFSGATTVGTATCLGADGCLNPTRTGTKGTAVVRIAADGSNPPEAFGYLAIDTPLGTVVAEEQYAAGYGYGYGYGFGGSAETDLVFQVTLSPSELGRGHFWITFTIDTGSATMGNVESARKYIRVSAPATQPTVVLTPSTPVSTTPPVSTPVTTTPATSTPATTTPATSTPASTTPVTSTPAPVVAPTVELELRSDALFMTLAFSSITVDEGVDIVPVDLTKVNEKLGTMEIGVDGSASELSVSVAVVKTEDYESFGAEIPQTGFKMGNLALDIRVTQQRNVDIEGAPSAPTKAKLEFLLTDEDLGGQEAKTTTLLHKKDGKWVSETTVYKGLVNGKHVFEAEFDSFSPFAVTFDVTPPVIGTLSPENGVTANALSTVAAILTDNRGIDPARTTLYIDGQAVAATITATGIFYTPAAPMLAGLHQVRLVATDLSGHEAEQSWAFTATEDAPLVTTPASSAPTQTTTAPTGTPPTATPPPAQDDDTPGFGLVALLAAMGAALLVLRRRKA